MPGWSDFRNEIDALEGNARSERARSLIAGNQAALDDDPPGWLLEAAGSRAMEEELETEDISDVELLRIGGPIHAVGSPKGGEHLTKKRLAEIVDDTRALAEAGELRAPVKLGHSLVQKLLRDSGLTEGEIPAAGWIDAENIRLSEDKTAARGDLKKVPKTMAKLIRAGAYRTRSAELAKTESQALGRTVEMYISGISLLGQKAPAIRTLDDIVRLYERDELDHEGVIAFAEGDVVWQPNESFEAIRQDLNAALNPGTAERRYWVRDVASGKALVTDWREEGKAWVVAFTRDDAGVTLAPAVEWVEAEEAWVETVRAAEQRRLSESRAPADTSDVPDLNLNEEQTRSLAETLGVEGDEITAEQLAEAATALKEKAEATPAEKRELEDSEVARKLAEETAARETLAEELKTVQEERRLEQRDVFVEGLVSEGKIPPADKEKWETHFDTNPAMARSFAEELEPDETLVRTLGSDGDGGVEPTEAETAYLREFAQREGVDEEALI